MLATRAEILSQYTVDQHGTITSPGKFEGTPIYTPHFWGLVLDGDSDETYDASLGRCVNIIKIESWDREEYPELDEDGVNLIQVYEDDQGFVHLDALDNQDKENTDEHPEDS